MTTSKKLLVSIVSLAALVIGSSLFAEEKKCPVSGEPTDGSVVTNVNGQAVDFCCEKCQAKYEKGLNLTDGGAEKCPVSGEDAEPERRVVHATTTANYFCCEKCVGKFVEEKGFADVENKEPGKCPYSGEDADPEAVVNVNGLLHYFCCEKCVAKFKTELAATDAGPGKCPISKEDADPEAVVFFRESKAVYFCCEKCEAKYVKEHFAAAAPADEKVREE